MLDYNKLHEDIEEISSINLTSKRLAIYRQVTKEINRIIGGGVTFTSIPYDEPIFQKFHVHTDRMLNESEMEKIRGIAGKLPVEIKTISYKCEFEDPLVEASK